MTPARDIIVVILKNVTFVSLMTYISRETLKYLSNIMTRLFRCLFVFLFHSKDALEVKVYMQSKKASSASQVQEIAGEVVVRHLLFSLSRMLKLLFLILILITSCS